MTPDGRILLVFDVPPPAAFLATIAGTAGPQPIELLSLTSDARTVSDVHAALSALGSVPSAADGARLLELEAQLLRSLLPEAIAAIARATVGGAPVAEALRAPDRGSFWWLTPFAERNPLVSPFVTALAQLAAVERRLDAGPPIDALCVCVAGRHLRESLHAAAAARSRRVLVPPVDATAGRVVAAAAAPLTFVPVAARLCWQALHARVRLGRPPPPRAGGVTFATYFPALKADAADAGRFEDRYFHALSADLDARGVSVDWLLLPEPVDGHTFGSALALAARFRNAGTRLGAWQQWLSWRSLLRALALHRRARRWYRAHSGRLEEAAVAALGRPASRPIVAGALRKSFFGARAFTALAMREAFVAALAAGAPAALVYCSEFQPWEAGLCDAAARRHVRTIGFQHTTIPSNLFNYRRSPREREAPAGADFPLPSILAANGARPARLLRAGGVPDVRIVEAIRHGHVAALLRRSRSADRNGVAVIGSIDAKETRALLAFADAARAKVPDLRFVVRLHPFARVDVADRWEEDDGPLVELLASVSRVIVGSSSVALEAIASGCDVIQPLLPDAIQTGPLDASEGWHRAVSTVPELVEALRVAPGALPDRRRLIEEIWCLPADGLPRWREVLPA